MNLYMHQREIKIQVVQNECPLITHAKCAGRMRSQEKRFKTLLNGLILIELLE